MVNADRLCVYVLMFGLIMFIPSIHYITFIDEMCASAFLSIALLDSISNRNWHRYKPLWIILTILSFYALYSIFFLNNNTVQYIITDVIIELKPFIPFIIFLGLAPHITGKDKKIIKTICLINCSIIALALFCGMRIISLLVFHPMYCGLVMFVCCIFYLYCCLDSNNKPSRQDIVLILTFLTIGLLCEKAKYFGSYVLTVYFILLYKPGVTKNLTPKHIVMLSIAILGVLAVSWKKIDYFFVSGNSEGFDPTVIESFARPVLYLTGWEILFDHFPFGTGLASFSSAASIMNYSNVYYEYGINSVWGLSPDNPSFACDAFYPSLAQFGIVGLILFIIFWCYAYRYLRVLIRTNPERYKYPFIIGSLVICSLLIESTTATTLTHNSGLLLMSMLGIIAAIGKGLMAAAKSKTQKGESENLII